MQEPQPISETNTVRDYLLNKNERPMQSTQNTIVERLLKPLIKPQETPEQVLTRVFKTQNYEEDADYVAIINHLTAYQKGGKHRNWDDYAEKIPQEIREKLALILGECSRNGFISPSVYNGGLFWTRIMTHRKMTDDLCTLCRRECNVRSDIDSGAEKLRRQNKIKNHEEYEEPKKCWEDV